jgi:aminocarboxymuconate-semialdehyde decarboxylase
MTIDVHAHYVPPELIETVAERGKEFGVSVARGPSCQCAFHFEGGPKVRPFFPDLVEPLQKRLVTMDAMEVHRQVLSIWADIFAPHLSGQQAISWHRLMNEHMASFCERERARFALLASVPLPDAQASARVLEDAVHELGAVGAVIPANVEDVNLGDLNLDPFWEKAVELDVGIFIHPVQAVPLARSARYGLTQVVQYTSDTTMTAGSIILSGVLDRFPDLRLLLAHGGGGLPYLIGRFDCMHERMDKVQQNDVAKDRPSASLRKFFYDTIVHDPAILKWLASHVSTQQIVLGSDYSFPPADRDPVGTVRKAGFARAEEQAILCENALTLFPKLVA